MILKILTRHSPSYQNLIEYILQEGKGKYGEPPPIITHNLRSKEGDIQGYVKEYLQNEAMRQYPRKGNIMLYHEILSFGKRDRQEISNQKLLDIAQEYIKQRGIEGVYVGAIHNEKEHQHIHFAVSGLQLRNGLAHRLTHESLRELKLTMQEYHKTKYPEIEHSNCEHGAGKPYLTNKEYHLAQRTNRNTIKQEIQQTINTCYQQAKSRNEFLALLQEQGLHHYERKGIPQGIVYDKYKFRFNRLGITYSDLPITNNEMKKEQNILNEIQWLRQATPQKDRLLDFEEAAISFNKCKLQDLYNTLDELEEEKHKLIVQLEYKSTPELQKAFEEVEERQSRLTERAEELSLEVEVERFSNLEKESPVGDRDVDDDLKREEDNITNDLEELRDDRENEERELDEDMDINF